MSRESSSGPHFLILHGPLLDRLGQREPEIYGDATLAQLNDRLATWAQAHAVTLTTKQTADETELVTSVAQAAGTYDGIIMNPAAFTHTSVALRDAVAAVSVPVIEVHLSNVAAREPFRRHSLIAPVAAGTIFGMGMVGYEVALEAMLQIHHG